MTRTNPTHAVACMASLLSMLLLAADALAAPLPADPLQRECWLRSTRDRTRINLREPTGVDFSNLGKRQRLRSPFQVDFAIRGMGVVPAGKAMEGTGHHHLLIDTPLPVDVRAKIPFSDTHKHFGKGQTGTVLDLPPGVHKLRLLFADHEHRPHFVFSPEIEVEVTGPRTAQPLPIERSRFAESCAEWTADEMARPRPPGEYVTVLNLRDGEPVTSPFNLRLGVDGYGVCAAGPQAERTGRFVLEIRQDGRLMRRTDLTTGATQLNVSLPDGRYAMALRFISAAGAELLPAYESTLVVTGQDNL